MNAGAATREEVASQPACWRRTARVPAGALPPRGVRVAAVGCGTSLYVAQSYAAAREAAGAWSEAYPAMEYRHGPLSVAGPDSLVWMLAAADGLGDEVRATGATVVEAARDPLAELVLVHRAALALAAARGLDPDAPRHLSRSVVF